MDIRIKKLRLRNFKGVESLDIDFTADTVISGENGTGKTTIYDAYCWLLWDKDSLNRADFEIKTLVNGEPIHGAEHSVEGTFQFGDQEVVLEKVYKEIWTQKRGSATKEFTGHTTDYFMNSVPVAKKDYQARLATIITEDQFKLLSNTAYFNAVLNKNERRKVLVSLIDDVSTASIVAQNKDLEKLPLKDLTIDEVRAKYSSMAKKINEQLKSLPIRIDEALKSKTSIDFGAVELQARMVRPAIQKLEKEIEEAGPTDAFIQINDEIRELIVKQEKICLEADEQYQEAKDQAMRKVRAIKSQKQEMEWRIKDLELKGSRLNEEEGKLNEEIEKLRADWIRVNGSPFEASTVCPTCHQELPADQIEATRERFHLNKSNHLEVISKEATEKKQELTDVKDNILEVERQLKDLREEYAILRLPEEEEPVKVVPKEYDEIDAMIAQKKEALDQLDRRDTAALKTKKEELILTLEGLNNKLALKGQNALIDQRIEEYKSQEKELAAAYEDAQYMLHLCDEYTKVYTSLVSDQINGMFSFVSFKLFDIQVNGAVVETCEATIGGVPYSDANSAAKVNAGIDVIQTLSKKYMLSAPVWIDNAESINQVSKMDGQLIRLVVSKDDKLKIS